MNAKLTSLTGINLVKVSIFYIASFIARGSRAIKFSSTKTTMKD